MFAQPMFEPIDRVLSAMPHLRGVMLTSRRGEVLASRGEDAAALEALGSFVVGLSELAARLVAESGSGEMRSMFVSASEGNVCIQVVDDDRLLFALCGPGAAAGLIAHELAWCAERIPTTH
jgi:predicted regulator of Ras-like GTPase activity (Roadblock/LC7/MglB family)